MIFYALTSAGLRGRPESLGLKTDYRVCHDDVTTGKSSFWTR